MDFVSFLSQVFFQVGLSVPILAAVGVIALQSLPGQKQVLLAALLVVEGSIVATHELNLLRRLLVGILPNGRHRTRVVLRPFGRVALLVLGLAQESGVQGLEDPVVVLLLDELLVNDVSRSSWDYRLLKAERERLHHIFGVVPVFNGILDDLFQQQLFVEVRIHAFVPAVHVVHRGLNLGGRAQLLLEGLGVLCHTFLRVEATVRHRNIAIATRSIAVVDGLFGAKRGVQVIASSALIIADVDVGLRALSEPAMAADRVLGVEAAVVEPDVLVPATAVELILFPIDIRPQVHCI